MDNTEKFYIEAISAFINERKIEDDREGIDYDQLYKLCEKHNTYGMIYAVLDESKINIPKNKKAKLREKFLAEIAIYSKRKVIEDKLVSILNKNKIKHVVIKGMKIAKLYPQPELRTMGDTDILIDACDMESVHSIMLNLKAKFYQEQSDENVRSYDIGRFHFEIHNTLSSDQNLSGVVNYEKYFKGAMDRTVKEGEYSYRLEDVFNITFIIYHIAKHFYNNGCGVRMIADIAVVYNRYEDIFNEKELWQELEKIELRQFTERILYLCHKWFGINWKKCGMSKDEVEMLSSFILSGGIYGKTGRNADAQNIKKNYKTNGEKNSTLNYIKGMIRWAFPSCKSMRNSSEWFRNKPAVFLPIAYIIRFKVNAKERGGTIKWLKSIAKGKKEILGQEKILKIVALEEEGK